MTTPTNIPTPRVDAHLSAIKERGVKFDTWCETPFARQLERELQAAEKCVVDFGWKPIATVPPGTLVDLWTVGFGESPHRVCDCYKDPICSEWRTLRPANRLFIIPEQYVTHWMLAPQPPALAAYAETKGQQ